MTTPSPNPYVSRGGLKLGHALREFSINARGMVCADFGCSTGGFTDCLLQTGAARVFAIDTAYGQLAWTLRNDPRVAVRERTNALHAVPEERVDLVVADAGWTPQRLLVPAALRWLTPEGRMISLVKPHYEFRDRGGALPRGGVLDDGEAERIARETVALLASCGAFVEGLTRSPILGGEKKGKGTGNAEWLVLLRRSSPPSESEHDRATG